MDQQAIDGGEIQDLEARIQTGSGRVKRDLPNMHPEEEEPQVVVGCSRDGVQERFDAAERSSHVHWLDGLDGLGELGGLGGLERVRCWWGYRDKVHRLEGGRRLGGLGGLKRVRCSRRCCW